MSLCLPNVELKLSNQNGPNRKNRTEFRQRVNTIIYDPNNHLKVYLISSRKNKQKWKLPGGGIEQEENIKDTAYRETLEEAGVYGVLTNYLGEFNNSNKKTHTYLCTIECKNIKENWLENTRNRSWFTIYEAFYLLEGEDKDMLLAYAVHNLSFSP